MRRITRQSPVSASRTAVGYVRMSPGSSDASPEVQGPKLAAFCEREGLDLSVIYFDFHISGGAGLFERPGLGSAIAAVQSGKLAAVVVSERTRLARDAGIASDIEGMLKRCGARTLSADGRGNGTGDDAAFDRDIANVLSAHERRAIRRRTREALAMKRAAGEALGRVPYGYQRGPVTDPKRPSVRAIEPCPEEQAVLSRVRELEAHGFSCPKIAAVLREEGFRTRVGSAFVARSIHSMLTPAASERRRAKRVAA